MGLYTDLQKAQSEEDVKQTYIKHLKLETLTNKYKGQLSLGLVDIKTDTIWFEAKHKKTNPIEMFTQLIYYVIQAKNTGQFIPPFLAVIDSQQAAILETERTESILADKSIQWGKSASSISPQALEQVAKQIQTHYVVYNLKDYENEFKQAIQIAFSQGKMVRTAITPNNLRTVFDNWVNHIGNEIITPNGEHLKPTDYALFFYADIMNDGGTNTYNTLTAQLITHNNNPAFMLNGVLYTLASTNGYNKFWSIYNRPPAKQDRNYLLERRDTLIPLEAKLFKGAFYTPLHVVEQAYEYLNTTLGKNWQKDYIVWDMCCGTGNLQVKHSNYRNIFMSTLDNEDVNIMQASKVCVGANIFQYDYLNDDIDANGTINYSLTNKIPKPLQELLQTGTINGVKKKLLILINPPYAEATAGIAKGEDNKTGVAKTKVANILMHKNNVKDYGKASNELFTQFIARILQETPKTNTTLAMFSTLKYVNAPNFSKFREHFKATYLNGFVVHSKAFEGLKGDFPIGFLMWQLSKPQPITTITAHVLTKNAINIGTKNFYNLPNNTFLNVWINRPKANQQFAVPLKNAITGYTGIKPLTTWADNAIGYMCVSVNDVQHATQNTFLLSSTYGGGHGMYITPQNLLQASVVFAVRRVINPTWLNDRDQFLQPNVNLTHSNPNIYNIKTTEGAFVSNCLAYMLFSGSNLTASSNNLQYNNQTYSITNHFIPFTEEQVNANARFESDFLTTFIAQHKLKFTTQATAVLNCAKAIWQLYFATNFSQGVKAMYHLQGASVGWYQVRKSLQEESKNNPQLQLQFNNLHNAFKLAFNNLSNAIEPQVYNYNFLKQ